MKLPLLLCLSAVAFGAMLGASRTARAESGDGVGLGPVLAFSPDRTDAVSLGWELSGSKAGFLQRGSIGGSYVLSSRKAGAPSFHYAAWEPWYLVGFTLGVAVTNEPRVKANYGLWEGIGVSVSGREYSDVIDDDTGPQWVLSVSVGWRGIGFDHQFYLTPKLWRLHGWDAFT